MEQNIMENEYIPVAVVEDEDYLEEEIDEDYYSSNSLRKRVYLEQKEVTAPVAAKPEKKQTLAGMVSNFVYYHKALFIAAGVVAVLAIAYVLTGIN